LPAKDLLQPDAVHACCSLWPHLNEISLIEEDPVVDAICSCGLLFEIFQPGI